MTAGVLLIGSVMVLSAASATGQVDVDTPANFQVKKIFSDHNTADVTVSLSCSKGTVNVVDSTASEADPADFTISSPGTNALCTATETVPAGYVGSGSPPGTCSAVVATYGVTVSCTITNTLTQIAVTTDDNGDEEGNGSATVTGSGFPPNTNVTVDIHSKVVVLGTVTADANGSFTETFEIPCRVGDGEHTVTATAATGQRASAVVDLDGCEEEHHDDPVPAAALTVEPKFTG